MRKKKTQSFLIGGIVILIALISVFIQNSSKNSKLPVLPTKNIEQDIKTTTTTTTTTTNTNINTYTLRDVSTHNKRSDCWTAIEGEVYNVTSWIDQHPGGAQYIVGLCGIDGSISFNAQHGGERRPASELTRFKIGTIK